jgi:alcohol dehydrogenase class IV
VPKLNNSQLDELAYLASTDPAIMFNPKESSIEDIIGIYERAY